jgi:hypothetical protein
MPIRTLWFKSHVTVTHIIFSSEMQYSETIGIGVSGSELADLKISFALAANINSISMLYLQWYNPPYLMVVQFSVFPWNLCRCVQHPLALND